MSLFTMPLFLDDRAKPVATVSSDGTFTLTILTYAPIHIGIKDTWYLIFTGQAAFAFWTRYANDLVPGGQLLAGVDLVRPFHNRGLFGAQIDAFVSSIEINPHQPEAVS